MKNHDITSLPRQSKSVARVPTALVRRPITIVRPIILAALAAGGLGLAFGCAGKGEDQTTNAEILWDNWGVPHIYAETNQSLFFGFGWAQAKSHADLILELYGQARGRAAEYWGEEWIDSDRWVRTMGIYQRAEDWYLDQTPEFRQQLDAFAEGFNRYAEEHADQIDQRYQVVLPVSAVDILAHTQRVIHFSFIGNPAVALQAKAQLGEQGSNALAIGPTRSESGNAMLLLNPHLSWLGDQMFYEFEVEGPDSNFYGATLVGFPVPTLGFNTNLGWSHTVNTFDGADAYNLTLSEDGYLLDGVKHSFAAQSEDIFIKQNDGNLRKDTITVRSSLHGPIIAHNDDRAIAYRVVGTDAPGMLEEWWDMSRAENIEQFESALRRLQIPMFNVMYADKEGHILYVYNAREPKRSSGTFNDWAGLVPGDVSTTLWTEIHQYDDLPRIADPQSGWLQNSNDPPWTATFPSPLNPHDFPSYLSPQFMHFRAQKAASMMYFDDQISFDELVNDKHSNRMLLAERFADNLIEAAYNHGDKNARAAADVLAAWDRSANATSKGAVLFQQWAEEMKIAQAVFGGDATTALMNDIFVTPWTHEAPFMSPDGLANPEKAAAALSEAAQRVEKTYGDIAVAWGDVYRIQYGGKDLPANGAPGDPTGVFRVAWFRPIDDEKYAVIGGDSFYSIVEFSEPIKARVLLSYGNSTQPNSPHLGDQLELYSQQKMRTPLLERSDVEKHLILKEALRTSGR